MGHEVCKFRRGDLSRLSERTPLGCWVEAMSQLLGSYGLGGHSGGGGPGQPCKRLARASVVLALISGAYVGCAGPGLEPPNNDQNGAAGAGGLGAGAGGAGGTTGGVGGASGSSGFGNPGSGGMSSPTGGLGGTGGGMAGGTGGASGTGAGGLGGAGGGSGANSDPDAGMSDGGAPIMECEESREVVDVTVFGFPTPTCRITATDDVLTHSEQFAVAITMVEGEETMWPERKEMSDACGEDEAFIFDQTLDLPRIDLCPAVCEAFVAAQENGVTVELIYGCDPPQ
jgi:hypothetical protein